MKPALAYVDDNLSNLECYTGLLSDHFEVDLFQSPLDFEKVINEKDYDCYLFDFQMPRLNGLQLLEKIRNHPDKKFLPVFIISSEVDNSLRVDSFKGGATDFFDRYLNTEELIARIESRISSYKLSNPTLKLGNLTINQKTVDCFLNDEKLVLTLIEFKILSHLVQDFPERVPKANLVVSIWGNDFVNDNNLNTHLYNLRVKLETWSYELNHSRKFGYGIVSKQ